MPQIRNTIQRGFITIDEFKSHAKEYDIYQKVLDKSTNSVTTGKMVYDKDHNFYVDVEKIAYAIVDNISFYTFAITTGTSEKWKI